MGLSYLIFWCPNYPFVIGTRPNELASVFRGWYPDFSVEEDEILAA